MHTNVFVGQDKYNREIKSVDNVFANFLVEKGLFEEIEITKDNVYELADLIGGHVKIDVFCPKCGENRVFSCEPVYKYLVEGYESRGRSIEEEIIAWQQTQNVQRNLEVDEDNSWSWFNKVIAYDIRLMVFRFYCAMDDSHRLDYIVITEDNKMKKIGQFPSIADLSFPELKEFRKVMASQEDEKELKRAIGLYANGIGIGSFVYLRRIFERIINTACTKAIRDGKYEEKELMDLRVNERIKKLSGYLPQAIIDSPVAYGIISKGIHEMNEEECRRYFPVLQSFIMMVLRQWESIRKEAEEADRLKKQLNKIASNS